MPTVDEYDVPITFAAHGDRRIQVGKCSVFRDVLDRLGIREVRDAVTDIDDGL